MTEPLRWVWNAKTSTYDEVLPPADKSTLRWNLEQQRERNGGFTISELAHFLNSNTPTVRKWALALGIDLGPPKKPRIITQLEAQAIIADVARRRGRSKIRVARRRRGPSGEP